MNELFKATSTSFLKPVQLCANVFKEPDAFGQTGDEIVVRCPIPWGHFKVGAKEF